MEMMRTKECACGYYHAVLALFCLDFRLALVETSSALVSSCWSRVGNNNNHDSEDDDDDDPITTTTTTSAGNMIGQQQHDDDEYAIDENNNVEDEMITSHT